MAINRRKPPIYNPQDIEPERLAKLFVIRTELREKLLASIRKYSTGKGRRHQLIVGARGLGKTTMLRSLYDIMSGDTTLTAKLIPLRFREEQYNVDRPSEAVINWIEALQSELEMHPEFAEDADGLLELAKKVRREVDEPRSLQAGVEGLRSWCQKRKRKLLLLLDNLDLILTRFGKSAELFGPVVCDEPWHMIVGGTAADTTFVTESTSPYCNQFEIHTLSNLSLAESRLLLDQLSKDREDEGDLLTRLDSDRGRLETFHLLTGGNVRTTVLLHDVLASEKGGSLDAQLNALLDDHTNYFKSRFEAYSDQSQRVLDALMREWDPMTAAQLAEATRLEVQKVSAHLDRLVKQGIVQQVGYYNVDAKSPMGKHGYQIEERFFQIWFNMRMAPGQRAKTRMRWLAEFVHDLFGPDGIQESAERLLKQFELQPPERMSTSCEYAKSLADFVQDQQLANELRQAANELQEPKQKADRLSDSGDSVINELTRIINDPASPAQIRAMAFVDRGYLHGQAGHQQEEIADYTRCIELPGAPVDQVAMAFCNRGIVHSQAGRIHDAISDCTKCINLPGAPIDQVAKALCNRAIAYCHANLVNEAIADYTGCIVLNGAPVEQIAIARYNRGVVHCQAGCMDEAIADFTRCIELPGAPIKEVAMALTNRGVAYSKSNRIDSAVADLSRCVKLPGVAVDQTAMALTRLGIAHSQAGRMDEAIDDYSQCIKLPMAPIEEIATAHYNRGVAHGDAGRIDEEISDYTSCIELLGAPVDLVAKALYNRGVANRRAGRVQDLIADCTRCIELYGAPLDQIAKALNTRAMAYCQVRRVDEAIVDYTRCIELSGTPVDQIATALRNRGVYFAQAGRLDEAIADFTRCIELIGASSSQIAASLYNRGIAQGKRSNVDEEMSDYTRCIAFPGAPVDLVARALNSRGVVNNRAERVYDAITDYTRCIELSGAPVDQIAMALCNRGVSRAQVGRLDEAIADYTQCIELPGAPVDQVARAYNSLAWNLYEIERDANSTRGGSDVEGLIAARKACESWSTIDHQLPLHTLGCLLALRGEWTEAWELAPKFCPADRELLPGVMVDDLVEFFQHAARQGRAKEAVEFLERQGQKDRLRPLYEALRAEQYGTIDYLKSVAPEVRTPAEVVLRRMKSSLVGAARKG